MGIATWPRSVLLGELARDLTSEGISVRYVNPAEVINPLIDAIWVGLAGPYVFLEIGLSGKPCDNWEARTRSILTHHLGQYHSERASLSVTQNGAYLSVVSPQGEVDLAVVREFCTYHFCKQISKTHIEAIDLTLKETLKRNSACNFEIGALELSSSEALYSDLISSLSNDDALCDVVKGFVVYGITPRFEVTVYQIARRLLREAWLAGNSSLGIDRLNDSLSKVFGEVGSVAFFNGFNPTRSVQLTEEIELLTDNDATSRFSSLLGGQFTGAAILMTERIPAFYDQRKLAQYKQKSIVDKRDVFVDPLRILSLWGPSSIHRIAQYFSKVDLFYPIAVGGNRFSNSEFPFPLPTTDVDSHVFRVLLENLLGLEETLRHRVERGIDRLMRSQRSLDLPDAALELCVSLESLLASGEGGIAQTIATRVAWFVGAGLDDRLRIHRLIKKVYKMRSDFVHAKPVKEIARAHHKGSIGKSKKIYEEMEAIDRFPEYLLHDTRVVIRDCILKILEVGRIPDWNRLSLGGIV